MTDSLSFRNLSLPRPEQYRTPSPPRHAIEPISPGTSIDDANTWNLANYDNNHERYNVSSDKSDIKMTNRCDGVDGASGHHAADSHNANKHHGHGRSGSTIDTLATIALATSPTFSNHDYEQKDDMHPSPQLPRGVDERPLKRARSERAPSPALPAEKPRPNTSHIAAFDSMKTDAELLLNLRRPKHFTFHPSGVSSQVSSIPDAQGSYAGWYGSLHSSEGFNSDYSAYLGTSLSSPRVRSKSDGAAIHYRPTIAGFTNQSYSPSITESVLLEEPAMDTIPNPMPDTGYDTQDEYRLPNENCMKFGGADTTEETDIYMGAKCAACNLVRMTDDEEDQANVTWINCDGCDRWFHIVCAGFKNDREIRTVDKFICRACRPVHGSTTFVRKSSRMKTTVDYAGLHQGFVKPSVDTPEHHYIQPIKEGKIEFLPDRFTRMPPEQMTTDFFEKGVGMTEPVVVPAAWNKRTSFQDSDKLVNSNVLSHPYNGILNREAFDTYVDNLADRNYEQAPICGQDLLGMVIPEGLTVRDVANLYGLEEHVEVIDVKSQQGETKRWNLRKWADYYYDKSSDKAVRNVISLEISHSPLGDMIQRPKIVRDIDLQDSVWPAELRAIGDYPKVQLYCLMSVADCYTDFHIDFGGSSVYYHIVKGTKTFFFIPPKEKYLKKYEEWCNSPAQDTTFLGDQTKECYRVDLSAGDTMLIPSGWIHAVWTPADSLVIGGNFLTRMNYGMQIKIANIEKDTHVPRKFRYPFFQKIMWYAAIKYMEDDPVPPTVAQAFAQDKNYSFCRHYPASFELGQHTTNVDAGDRYYNSRYYSKAELEGLPDLSRYLLRTALIAGGYNVPGVTNETRNAVKRSIPKGQSDPVETVRRFGVWVAWKRGNEQAASWTRPDAAIYSEKVGGSDRKTNKLGRRSNRNASSMEMNEALTPPSLDEYTNANSLPLVARRSSFTEWKPRITPKTAGLGPKRVACDACRKRRIRCRHKDENQVDGDELRDGEREECVNVHEAAMEAGRNGISSKKGRSKACEECRKSKRRCIHDESGRIDPVKAQERSKPRFTPGTKRPRSRDDPAAAPTTKKAREIKSEAEAETEPLQTVATITPEDECQAQAQSAVQAQGQVHGQVQPINQPYASPPSVQMDPAAPEMMEIDAPAKTLVSPPTSLADEADIPMELREEKDRERAMVEEQKDLRGASEKTRTHTPMVSRTSSRQPGDVLTTALADSNVKINEHAKKRVSVTTTPAASHTSTTAVAATTDPTAITPIIHTPTVNFVHAPSISLPSVHARQSSQPTPHPISSHSLGSKRKDIPPTTAGTGTKRTTTATVAMATTTERERAPVRSQSQARVHTETDAESLRLIRELHEQEFSLRRRGTKA